MMNDEKPEVAAPGDLTDPSWWGARLHRQIRQGPRTVSSLTDEFRAAMDAAVDQFIQNQDEQAMQGDTRDAESQSPREAQGQPHHICARYMIIAFFDGSDFQIDFQNPIAARGWSIRNIQGVDMLVIGHGVPRKMFPLKNIRYFDLIPEEVT